MTRDGPRELEINEVEKIRTRTIVSGSLEEISLQRNEIVCSLDRTSRAFDYHSRRGGITDVFLLLTKETLRTFYLKRNDEAKPRTNVKIPICSNNCGFKRRKA